MTTRRRSCVRQPLAKKGEVEEDLHGGYQMFLDLQRRTGEKVLRRGRVDLEEGLAADIGCGLPVTIHDMSRLKGCYRAPGSSWVPESTHRTSRREEGWVGGWKRRIGGSSSEREWVGGKWRSLPFPLARPLDPGRPRRHRNDASAYSLHTMTPDELEKYRVQVPRNALPRSMQDSDQDAHGGFFYIPDFISSDEETYLIEKVNDQQSPRTPRR